MTGRSRKRNMMLPVVGYYDILVPTPSTYQTTAYRGLRQECDDTIGNFKGDNSFRQTDYTEVFPVLWGDYVSGGRITKRFRGFPINYRMHPPIATSKYPLPTSSQHQTYASQVVGRSNPSKPVVNVPAFVAELKDLPMLVKAWGGNLLKKCAAGNLSWRFCLRPMMSDIQKMMTFANYTFLRFGKIQGLLNGNGLRKRCSLGKTVDFKKGTALTQLHSQGANLYGYGDTFYSKEEWATVHWKWNGPAYMPHEPMEQLKLIRRLYYGITTFNALRTAWELTPWSWLIDWFFDVGSWINANDNSLPVTPTRYCYMRTTTTMVVIRISQCPSWVTPIGAYYTMEVEKRRIIPSVSLLAPGVPAIPALEAGQWSILGSLAVLRGGKWARLGAAS